MLNVYICTYEVFSFLYWIFLYNCIVFIDTVMFNMGCFLSLPFVCVSFGRIVAWIHFAFTILLATRFYLFEFLHQSTPYISKRNEHNTNISRYERFCILSKHAMTNEKHCMFWSFIACICVQFPVRPLSLIVLPSLTTIQNLLVDTLGIFMLSDLCFYIFHRFCHVSSVFKHIHRLHHSLRRPTSYTNCELFTLLDGIGHVFVFQFGFYLYYTFLRNVPTYPDLYNTIWIMSGLQWFIFGQCEHGGKNIPIRLIPGLHILQFIFGIHTNTPKLHDLHHSLLTVNYSLSGIFDRWFGTLKEH
jgi:sterol desaturase/sphingolipid hydroxylase (fatty acid hydroxylase superfamily)